MKRVLSAGLLCAGIALFCVSLVFAADPPKSSLTYKAVAPAVARADPPTPTPTIAPPTPTPFVGAVASLYLASGGVTQGSVVESRDVDYRASGPVFQDPSHPSRIAWYSNFGMPGWAGNNSIFAAHINYVGYGNGPFAGLANAALGDALYVTMANGDTYSYTVESVQVIPLSQIDMVAIVFPGLDLSVERVTLISCGGNFRPLPGGGEYDSRVVLIAERYLQ